MAADGFQFAFTPDVEAETDGPEPTPGSGAVMTWPVFVSVNCTWPTRTRPLIDEM